MPRIEGPRPFPDRLWTDSSGRSTEVTPLYVGRYRGPRTSSENLPHDFWELTVTMAGHGILHVDGPVALNVGVAVLVPPGVPHREDAPDPRLDTVYVALRGAHLPDHRQPLTAHGNTLPDQAEEIWLFAERGHGPIGPELDGLAHRMLGHFLRLVEEGAAAASLDAVDRAVRYFHEHLAEPVAIPDVAAACGCSTGHFQRLFRDRTGRSPLAYLTGIRIQQAMQLLTRTSLPVNEIAVQVGFPDPFYFSRRFRQRTGRSPRDYRG